MSRPYANNAPATDLAGALYKRFYDLMQDFVSPTEFINKHYTLLEVCELRYGNLGRGPKTLMEYWKNVLEDYSVDVSLQIGSVPKQCISTETGCEFIAYPSSLKLLVVGESFFIAEDFIIREQGNKN